MAASLLFYAWSERKVVVLLGASMLANWALALLLERTQNPLGRRWLVGSAVALNIGALIIYKYANLIVANCVSQHERASAFPAFRSMPLSQYFGAIEAYVRDHFGLRDWLIPFYGKLCVRYLNVSPIPNVVIGADGWLFYTGVRDGPTCVTMAGGFQCRSRTLRERGPVSKNGEQPWLTRARACSW